MNANKGNKLEGEIEMLFNKAAQQSHDISSEVAGSHTLRADVRRILSVQLQSRCKLGSLLLFHPYKPKISFFFFCSFYISVMLFLLCWSSSTNCYHRCLTPNGFIYMVLLIAAGSLEISWLHYWVEAWLPAPNLTIRGILLHAHKSSLNHPRLQEHQFSCRV